MTARGTSHLAASFLTSQRNADIAADYAEWLADKADAVAAEDALLAAARSSKSPDRVLARAQEFYDDFNGAIPIFGSITPTSGLAAGGTPVTITGENFTDVNAATVGGVALTSRVVVSDTEITGVTGAHAAGAVAVVVTNPSGSDTENAAFTYA